LLPVLSERYRTAADLPRCVPVFPLRRAIVLPRVALPLTIFEPRYLAMVDDALAGDRLLALVQPRAADQESPAGKDVDLRPVGGLGRLTAYEELEDGRVLITLTGVARCLFQQEVNCDKPYRLWNVDFAGFDADFIAGAGEDAVNREGLLDTLRTYLEARNLSADWSAIQHASTERLVNSLAVISPYGPDEKQALLEALDLKSRADMLVALAELELAAGSEGSGPRLQ
jgi:Lon protease-like protein